MVTGDYHHCRIHRAADRAFYWRWLIRRGNGFVQRWFAW